MGGDLWYFVLRGSGTFAPEFGPIAYEPGDWVFLPKATTFQHLPDPGDSLLLVVESPLPLRMAEHENVGRHTPIDPTMLDVPDIVDYRPKRGGIRGPYAPSGRPQLDLLQKRSLEHR